MFFINPTYLWALLGLLVPFAIHLWSKKEGVTIKVGSIKLLNDSDSKQTSTIRLNEWILLLLRMALVSLLVLSIARPRIQKNLDTVPITYVVEPSLLQEERVQKVLDTIQAGASIRLLKSGFPEIQGFIEESEITNTPYYWQLVNEMKTLQTDSIVVFASGFISGIRGSRPVIDKKIAWIYLDTKTSEEKVIKVTKKKDSLQLLSVHSDQHHLTFKRELISDTDSRITPNQTHNSIVFSTNDEKQTLPLTIEKPTKVLLLYQEQFLREKMYIEASLKAVSRYVDQPIDIQIEKEVHTSDFSKFDLVVWLSLDAIPEISTKLLAYKPDNLANGIIEKGSSDTVFYLTEPLRTENSIDKNLPEALVILLDFHLEVRNKIMQYDKRILDISALHPNVKSQVFNGKQRAFFEISNWLWVVFIVFFIVERGIAKYRKQ